MADALDSKSSARKGVRVRLPPPVLIDLDCRGWNVEIIGELFGRYALPASLAGGAIGAAVFIWKGENAANKLVLVGCLCGLCWWGGRFTAKPATVTELVPEEEIADQRADKENNLTDYMQQRGLPPGLLDESRAMGAWTSDDGALIFVPHASIKQVKGNDGRVWNVGFGRIEPSIPEA